MDNFGVQGEQTFLYGRVAEVQDLVLVSPMLSQTLKSLLFLMSLACKIQSSAGYLCLHRQILLSVGTQGEQPWLAIISNAMVFAGGAGNVQRRSGRWRLDSMRNGRFPSHQSCSLRFNHHNYAVDWQTEEDVFDGFTPPQVHLFHAH